jgi:magnesium transporter
MGLLDGLVASAGAAPGIEHDELVGQTAAPGPVTIVCVDYNAANAVIQTVDHLGEFLKDHRPEWSAVRWISVVGLSDLEAIRAVATKYNLHPLALEDVLHNRQRPKVEPYGGEDSTLQARLFIVARVPRLVDGELVNEQVSIFVGHNTVLTFQRTGGEIWDAVRQRVKAKGSRLRGNDASFLAYSLLDAAVDSCYPILEHYSDRAEELEERTLDHADPSLMSEIHQLRRDLLVLHRLLWPLREVVSTIRREPHECLSETTRVYMRDLYDHVIQLVDVLETYREMTSDLTDTYMSSISLRMNEVMKVLTIIGTIFIPLTFLAGVYGMNFHYLPELNQTWGYPVFWIVCVVMAVAMLVQFRRRDWI